MTQSTGTIMSLDDNGDLIESSFELISTDIESMHDVLNRAGEIFETFRLNEYYLDESGEVMDIIDQSFIRFGTSNPFSCARILEDIKQHKQNYNNLSLGRQARVPAIIECRGCGRKISEKYCYKCGHNNGR